MNTKTKEACDVKALPCRSSIRFMQNRVLQKFYNSVSRLYTNHGETERTIREVQKQVRLLSQSRYGFNMFDEKAVLLMKRTQSTGVHYIRRILDKEDIKISLHCVPDHYGIPSHCHPGTISITYVLKGDLQISQLSLHTLHNYQENESQVKSIRMTEKDVRVGLKSIKNIHKIKTLKTPCAFLSIRLKVQDLSSVQKPAYTSKLLLSIFSSVLLIAPSYALDAQKEIKKASKSLDTPWQQLQSIQKKVKRANKLRQGLGISQDSYQAAQLYLQAAAKGNAEAQYWLGVMYLDGQGITEDTDEALRWVSASADQEYAAAKQLLHIMLTTDEVLDC